MLAIEIVKSRKSKEPDPDLTAFIFDQTREQRIIVSKSGPNRNVLRIVPPLCLNEEDLHLVDERKDVFELDYDTFFKKQVLDQLDEFDKIEDVKNLVETYRNDAKSKQ